MFGFGDWKLIHKKNTAKFLPWKKFHMTVRAICWEYTWLSWLIQESMCLCPYTILHISQQSPCQNNLSHKYRRWIWVCYRFVSLLPILSPMKNKTNSHFSFTCVFLSAPPSSSGNLPGTLLVDLGTLRDNLGSLLARANALARHGDWLVCPRAYGARSWS